MTQKRISLGKTSNNEEDEGISQTLHTEIPAGLDDLLDDIEALVAEDSQTFVQGFVQKGGQ